MNNFRFDDIEIAVTRKDIQNVHLSVHPPDGRVTLVMPAETRLEVARAYAASRIGWIRQKQSELRLQSREARRKFLSGESHFVWGHRRLLEVIETDERSCVRLSQKRLSLYVKRDAKSVSREKLLYRWQLAEMHRVVPLLIDRWKNRLQTSPERYFLQRMKTKWGSCNHRAQTIRLNTELIKKPQDLLNYVVLHEMIHLIEPKHSDRFFSLLTEHYPRWAEARKELNELPVPNLSDGM